ncbi:MAG: DNA alkylation repair protein [Chlamydiales bacterium]|nr:DNA alkylation repair protein [Chlamydiales bacterium]
MKAELLRELKSLEDPEKAIADQRYHKSVREHWGVSMPQCEKLVRLCSKDRTEAELISTAEALWKTDLFDPMMCASKILCLPRVKPSLFLWNTIKSFLKTVDGWALEDGLCHAAWKCILANTELLDDLEGWTKHPNFWMRRAALVYTLPFAKPGKDPERMLGWASSYATDDEWFIQKAIGWWLRDLGEHNPDRVLLFLKDHWTQLKTVARKEATRKLSLELQQRAVGYGS